MNISDVRRSLAETKEAFGAQLEHYTTNKEPLEGFPPAREKTSQVGQNALHQLDIVQDPKKEASTSPSLSSRICSVLTSLPSAIGRCVASVLTFLGQFFSSFSFSLNTRERSASNDSHTSDDALISSEPNPNVTANHRKPKSAKEAYETALTAGQAYLARRKIEEANRTCSQGSIHSRGQRLQGLNETTGRLIDAARAHADDAENKASEAEAQEAELQKKHPFYAKARDFLASWCPF